MRELSSGSNIITRVFIKWRLGAQSQGKKRCDERTRGQVMCFEDGGRDEPRDGSGLEKLEKARMWILP